MKFEKIDPEEFPNMQETHRGRVSYPLLKGFLETDFCVAKLDRTGMQQSLQSLYSSVNAYARSHKMPVMVKMRSGELFLIRLDLLANGDPNPEWDAERGEVIPARSKTNPPRAITTEEVGKRFEVEKGQITK